MNQWNRVRVIQWQRTTQLHPLLLGKKVGFTPSHRFNRDETYITPNMASEQLPAVESANDDVYQGAIGIGESRQQVSSQRG